MPPQIENQVPTVPKKSKKMIWVALIVLVCFLIAGGIYIWFWQINNRFILEDWPSNYYASLAKKCGNNVCCKSSARFMADYNFLLAENGKCPEGFKTNQELCTGGYVWCESSRDTSTSTSDTNKSGIKGKVTIGPICPVQRIPPDPQCADRPFRAGFNILNQSGQIVESFISNADGTFSVSIPPGQYIIQDIPAPGTYPIFKEQSVTITENNYTQTNLQFDSGIR